MDIPRIAIGERDTQNRKNHYGSSIGSSPSFLSYLSSHYLNTLQSLLLWSFLCYTDMTIFQIGNQGTKKEKKVTYPGHLQGS